MEMGRGWSWVIKGIQSSRSWVNRRKKERRKYSDILEFFFSFLLFSVRGRAWFPCVHDMVFVAAAWTWRMGASGMFGLCTIARR